MKLALRFAKMRQLPALFAQLITLMDSEADDLISLAFVKVIIVQSNHPKLTYSHDSN